MNSSNTSFLTGIFKKIIKIKHSNRYNNKLNKLTYHFKILLDQQFFL